MVTVDFEMLDQYKDLYNEDVCKNNGMIMIGHNYLTGSELDLNSKLTVFLAQSKISFIADDSHFNYVDTIPWNNDRDEILLDLYDNDYPENNSGDSDTVIEILVDPNEYTQPMETAQSTYNDPEYEDVTCVDYKVYMPKVPELSDCIVAVRGYFGSDSGYDVSNYMEFDGEWHTWPGKSKICALCAGCSYPQFRVTYNENYQSELYCNGKSYYFNGNIEYNGYNITIENY